MKSAVHIVLAALLSAPLHGMPQALQEGASKAVDRTQQNQPFAQETSAQQGLLATREAELKKRASEQPSSADVLYQLALVLREEQKYRESLDIYTRAAALEKPTASQLRSVALDYVQLNDFEDAIHWLRIALGLEPENIDVLYSLGRCYYTKNDFPKAEASFTRVMQLHPDHIKAEENLGLTYDALNKPDLAEKALRNAAAWTESRAIRDPWPYLDLGTLLLEQSRPAEASPFLRKAVALDPSSGVAHMRLGRALLAEKKTAEAVAELEHASGLDPQNPNVHFELGRAYRAAGQADRARAEFDRCKTLYGNRNQD